MARIFGTDGIRGVANRELSTRFGFRLGWASAQALAEETNHEPVILVGSDTHLVRHVGSALVPGFVPPARMHTLPVLFRQSALLILRASINAMPVS